MGYIEDECTFTWDLYDGCFIHISCDMDAERGKEAVGGAEVIAILQPKKKKLTGHSCLGFVLSLRCFSLNRDFATTICNRESNKGLVFL